MSNSRCAPAMAGLVLAFSQAALGAQPVLQRGYDTGLSGANLGETVLNTTNVAPATFGLVFSLPVDDNVFAQPLYVPNVAVANQGTHNVVYVATMSDTLYAFDADAGGAPLWSVNFASSVGATPVPIANFTFSGNRNIIGNLGILSTPVIDPATNILYLVACTLENNTMVYRLHAVDITSGAEPYTNVVISGSYGGSTFDGRYQTQRVSLALSGSQVVFGFAAVELEYAGGYVGWVMAYDKRNLQQSGAFATVTTAGRGGGVWQSGRPPAIDGAGYVYVFTGNAYGSGYDGVNNFSESVLKLDPANGLKLIDWFTPGNWSALDDQDLDLTSSGPLLVPGTALLAGGGKTGDLYVLNTAGLGKYDANDAQVVQKLHISASEFRGGPVYWQRSAANGGPLLYNWGVSDWVKAYAFNGTTFGTTPSSQGGGTQIWPGGTLALSANGDQPGSGVLWGTVAAGGDAENNPPVPGALHAYDAGNVAKELWNSTMNASRDNFGNYAKFTPPLVANGRVYVATWSKQVAVYGLLPLPPPTVTLTVLDGGSGSGTIVSNPAGIACGSVCAANFPTGGQVTLTATAAAGSSFAGWSSGCAVSGNTCTIAGLTTPTTITATFNPQRYTLTVTKPTTPGKVTGNTGGINCGSTSTQTACSARYTAGSSVTLTATPRRGHGFVGWGGACAGTSRTCAVSMTQARSVSATFK